MKGEIAVMKMIENKQQFWNEARETLTNILDSLEQLPVLKASDFHKEDTAVVVIDMINGFAKKGALYSDRIEGIISYLTKVLSRFQGYHKIFFVDQHTEDSVEFLSYPAHCLKGTEESEIIEELMPFVQDNGIVIPKNSTNGFVSNGFSVWLEKYSRTKNFVILGDCTDICILQFALTIKAYFNERNTPSKVVVPVPGVETFHLDATNHHADLMNVFALYNMKLNGIELVSDIQ
jgi:nicotinamidase-related amidase